MLENPQKIKGKTYSLFGNDYSTSDFYGFTEKALEELLNVHCDEKKLLIDLQTASTKKKKYDLFLEQNDFMKKFEKYFESYVYDVDEYIRDLSIFKFHKKDLKTKKWQYYLYMLEFALTNRIYKERFLKCNVKIALLPHCLKDLTKICKAEMNGFDYQCKHCSKECFVNEADKMLKDNNIEPYIWMSSDLKKMAKKNFKEKKSLGVFGIACIPQLIGGMRMCEKKNIPVIGLPLDANRCVRWMGNFNPNSVNLNILKNILS